MTNVPSPASMNARRWAHLLLDVDDDTNLESAGLLRYVTERDFAVSLDETDALQILGNSTSRYLSSRTLDHAAYQGAEQQMETAVAGFASRFFEIPAFRRREQWSVLFDESLGFPHLAHWLANLEPGLDVDNVPLTGNESVDSLVESCSKAFLARPQDRARLRQAVAHLYCQDARRWERTVQYLTTNQPNFVAAIAPWLTDLHRGFLTDLTKRDPMLRPTIATATTATSSNSDSNWWSWFVVLSIVGAVIRGIARFPSTSESRPTNYSPTSPTVSRPLLPGRSPDEEKQIREQLRKLLSDKPFPEQLREGRNEVTPRQADPIEPQPTTE